VTSGVLPGVTRAVVLEICGQLKLDVQEAGIPPDRLRQMEGVFLSLSSWGVVEVGCLDGQPLNQSPLVGRLRAAYAEMLAADAPSANGYM
jgi:branched-subunit amino acid aminotransferase/4-amino-4-deoxychorismate lyase